MVNMKNFSIAIILIFFISYSHSQDTLILQPGSEIGKDSKIQFMNPNNNLGDYEDLTAHAWTMNGNPNFSRSFIQFDLSMFSIDDIILQATLSLYFADDLMNNPPGQYGDNESSLYRILEDWDEHVLTWNNQPPYSTDNPGILPISDSIDQSYPNIDVTELVQDMILNPDSSFGFMLKLNTEEKYRALDFASSDYIIPDLHPKLTIVYDSQGGSLNCSLGNDTTICSGSSVVLSPGNNYDTYLWQDGSTNDSLIVTHQGIYWVEVTLGNEYCMDSVYVQINNIPQVNLGKDTTICENASLILNPGLPNVSYIWQDSTTNSFYIVTSPGLYWVIITDGMCFSSDSIYVSFDYLPQVFLGNDTTIWYNDTLILDAGSGYLSYLWQDHSFGQFYSVSTTGIYHVRVENECGYGYDSIFVGIMFPPESILGPDTNLILGDKIVLDAGSGFDTYTWQDGSHNQTFVVTKGGKYWVDVEKIGVALSDTVYISEYKSSLYIPNAFSPNGDGLNDEFEPKGNSISSFHILIYNKRGTKVFESFSISDLWDGEMNGKQCPTGSYVYIIDFKAKDELGISADFRKSGTLILVR